MNSRQTLLVALFAILLFSSAPACVRKIHLDAVALGTLRLGIASLGMTLFLASRWPKTRRSLEAWNWRTSRALVSIGLVFGVHWLLLFLSIKISNAVIGAIGFSTYGIHLIVLGWLLGRGKVKGVDVVGLLLACAGTWLLIPEFSFQNEHTLGLAIGILSGLTAAVMPLLHQHFSDIDGNLRAWGQFTLALPVFFCCQPWAEWDVRASDLPLILYLGLGIALLGQSLWVHASTALSTTTISILSYLYLPMSIFLSFLTLGEKLAGRSLFGVGLVLVANALVLLSRSRRGTLEAKFEPSQEIRQVD